MKELKLDLNFLLKKAFFPIKRDVAGSDERTTTDAGRKQLGSKRAFFSKKGLEFEKFREFQAGDDARMIDWIASLRTQKMLVRVYAEEQIKDIIFFVDVSSSMSYTSHSKLKNEYAAELVATLAYAMSGSGDNIGMAMFTDHLVNTVPPSAGKQQFWKIVAELKTPAYYEGNCDMGKALSELIAYTRRSCVIIIVSDFIGLKPGWEKILEILSARNYEILGMMVMDPADLEFPDAGYIGQVVMTDPFSGEQLLVDPGKVAGKYKDYNQQRLGNIEHVFRRIGSSLLVLKTNESFVPLLRKFFFRRE